MSKRRSAARQAWFRRMILGPDGSGTTEEALDKAMAFDAKLREAIRAGEAKAKRGQELYELDPSQNEIDRLRARRDNSPPGPGRPNKRDERQHWYDRIEALRSTGKLTVKKAAEIAAREYIAENGGKLDWATSHLLEWRKQELKDRRRD